MAIDFNATPQQPVLCQHVELLDLIWAGHFVLDAKHHSARQDWVGRVLHAADEQASQAIALCQQANFPLINLLAAMQPLLPKILSLPHFIEHLQAMSERDFLLAYFDGEVSAQQLDVLTAAPERLAEFQGALNWSDSGSIDYLSTLIFATDEVRAAQIAVLNHVAPFAQAVIEQEYEKIASALTFVQERLKHNTPMQLAQQIKGIHFADKPYQHFMFCPCLFADTHNVFLVADNAFAVLYNCEQSAFHVDSQAEPLAEAFKIIADPKRLEILRMVRKRPTFAKVLAARLNLTTATMSRHIELLKKADLIREQKVERVKYISINEERFRRLQGQLTSHVMGDK